METVVYAKKLADNKINKIELRVSMSMGSTSSCMSAGKVQSCEMVGTACSPIHVVVVVVGADVASVWSGFSSCYCCRCWLKMD